MTRRTVIFAGPREVRVEDSSLPEPGSNEVLVATVISAISAGTEMLVYRDEFPPDLSVDMTLAGMGEKFAYPLEYGYAAVGRVVALGAEVDAAWQGQMVFAFQPHTSHFVAPVSGLMPVPDGIGEERAVFLPNMETAVNLVQDGAPVIGEEVAVIGQGVVGLLTTALLAQFPLDRLATVDKYAVRREASLAAGADEALDTPTSSEFDLVYELSGNPAALNEAIAITGYGGRIVVGSWYGQKQAPLALGGRFHRNRIQLVSSQVSTLSPGLTGRWTKERRLETAWGMLGQVEAERWISQQFPVASAHEAYRLLDERPSETLQVVLTYERV